MKKIKTNTDKYVLKCIRCKNNKGIIKKYNLNLCRRCFKDIAQGIGFKKLG